jgi:hypothetical protein
MSTTISRVTTFITMTPILSSEANAELNQICNLLNGTTTNKKVRVRTSDAGDPPLELDQLSTGPIAEFFQGGVLQAFIDNDGTYLPTNTTLATNFNADLLDGHHASFFAADPGGR